MSYVECSFGSCSNGGVERTLTPVVLNVRVSSSGKKLLYVVPAGTHSGKVKCSATVVICDIQFDSGTEQCID